MPRVQVINYGSVLRCCSLLDPFCEMLLFVTNLSLGALEREVKSASACAVEQCFCSFHKAPNQTLLLKQTTAMKTYFSCNSVT